MIAGTQKHSERVAAFTLDMTLKERWDRDGAQARYLGLDNRDGRDAYR